MKVVNAFRHGLSLSMLMLGYISHAQASVLLMQGDIDHYELAPYLDIAVDESGEIHWHHIAASMIELQAASKTAYPGFGFIDAAIWSRLSLVNSGPHTQIRYLEIQGARLQHLDLFITQGQDLLEHRSTGTSLPFTQRELSYRYPVFRLEIPPQTSRTLYLRSETQHSHHIPMTLRSESDMIRTLIQDSHELGLFYGSLLVLWLTSLGMLIVLRGSAHVYYSLFLGLVWLYSFIADGLAYQFFWPNQIYWNSRSIQWITPFALVTALLYTQIVAQTQRHAPALHRLIYGVIGVGLLIFLHAVLGDQRLTRLMLVLLALLSMCLISCAAWVAHRHRVPAARLFLLSWLALSASITIWLSGLFGVIADPQTLKLATRGGQLAQFILLGLATMVQVMASRRAREDALRETLRLKTRTAELTRAFLHMVPRESLGLLGYDDPADVRPGDHAERDLSMLYIDIRDFTGLSERMSGRDNFAFLNRYFAATAPCIREHGGFVCRYIGDAMLCAFPGCADDALQAALAVSQALAELNAENQQRNEPTIDIGMGIHSGPVNLAIIGDDNRLEISPFGETVDLTCEIEAQSKLDRCRLLISSETRSRLQSQQHALMRPLEESLMQRSRRAWLGLWEVYQVDEPALRALKRQYQREFEAALKSFADGHLSEAAAAMRAIASACPADRSSLRYAEAWTRMDSQARGD